MVEVDPNLKDARVDVLEHGATASIRKKVRVPVDSDQGRVETMTAE